MRKPELAVDGWCLHSGEEYHATAPETFPIPSLDARENLKPGDFVKLIFEIHVDSDEDPYQVERMWVIVREVTAEGYLGVLDNDPYCISENDQFWSGIELPFEPQHVIAIQSRDATSIALANETPRRRWSATEA